MSISILNSGASGGAAEQFGVMNALQQGGFISWSVAIILTIMLFFSLYILFTKWFEQQKIMNQGRRVRASFWNSNSLREAAAKLEKNSAYKQLVDDGLAAQDQHSRLTDPVEAHDWLHGSLRRSEDVINSQLNGGLAFLATVGATAPFIGLFGTVLGIYRALINIGQAGQASIDKVAGPVGEALIMTAFGLVTAVPAVLAYNWLQRRNKAISEDLNSFSNDVLGYLASNGAVKPTAAARKAGAPTAKPATTTATSTTAGQTGGVQVKQ
ncbi:MotA/TolQ/ExbB proton channel family protein [Sphingomonas sp.]|jgi:biopolymer transport protein ExbB|uniref:MotA/TolQ/ExbB proton channel family protein n=1 Tax=Sphingomonas sp. TaxID=28214 RepID=UPI002E308DC4|nr:MotA/TolQ/ExbB proton channel family protein [Sphingomonas sp.]HEX4694125.1 MotA/TolQ/ExbB proton channel family protein [Sphingomonas sp.]